MFFDEFLLRLVKYKSCRIDTFFGYQMQEGAALKVKKS